MNEQTNERMNSNINKNRDRAEGGAGGLDSPPPPPPLFCKNKNKLNKKKLFNKSNGVKNSNKSLIRKWPELLAKTNAQINRQNESLVVTIATYQEPYSKQRFQL